jgi:diaminobutyrate-2-oxoglutarate transaminase
MALLLLKDLRSRRKEHAAMTAPHSTPWKDTAGLSPLPTKHESQSSAPAIIQDRESNVRCYCRSFPTVFRKAKGSLMYSESGQAYIDFLCGAGALNYGHNNEFIKERLIQHINEDGLTHGLDLFTTAKTRFIQTFVDRVLEPKGLNYKLQFCGPTGTNAVEAAMKVARRAKGRPSIAAFMGGYHGMSLGSLAASGNRGNRGAAGISMAGTIFLPFASGPMESVDSIVYIEAMLEDSHSGIDLPAAIILETIQAEGGVMVAPEEWLRRLRALCDRYDILLICDEIQVGCYRSGPFFSFERAGIEPDIITLSKSIGGYGLPMSLVLLKPELDVWSPGEHTGTFRGNQLAFAAGAAALEFADLHDLPSLVQRNEVFISHALRAMVRRHDLPVRGLGMIWGIDFSALGGGEVASEVSKACFGKGLIVETAGRRGAVIKLLPPLTTEAELLEQGLQILDGCIGQTIAKYRAGTAPGSIN